MTVDTLTIVRALGISAVVVNHALRDDVLFHGGLNVLLFVSGINMASFAFNGSTRQTLGSFKAFTLRLVIPSVILAAVWNAAVYLMGANNVGIRWSELLMFSNWLTIERISLFPIWYVQVILQLMIVLALMFWAFDLTPRIRNAPVQATMIALGISLVIAVGSCMLWDTGYLGNHLPQILAWNFVIGWVYWALAVRNERTIRSRVVLSVLLLGCELLIFEWLLPFDGDVRIYVLSILGLLLIWVDTISLPAVLARPILLVSQATFYIFLFHYYAFWLAMRVGRAIGLEEVFDSIWMRLVVGFVLPVFLWMVVTAARRAYSKTRGTRRSAEAVPVAL